MGPAEFVIRVGATFVSDSAHHRVAPSGRLTPRFVSLAEVTRYRFLDGMGDVVDEHDFAEHAAALTWAMGEEVDDGVQRVEFLGPEGDWRWAGPLLG